MVTLQTATKAGLATGIDMGLLQGVAWKVEEIPLPKEELSAGELHRRARNGYSSAFGKWQKTGKRLESASRVMD